MGTLRGVFLGATLVAAAARAPGAFAAGPAIVGAPAPTADAPAPDAYHYPDWKDGRHDALYTEWWYFNLHDEAAGVDAIFSYFVTNPDDILGNARVQMVAVAYTRDATVSAIDPYPASAFEASTEQADVRIGANRASASASAAAAAAGTYHVTGATLDGRLAWDLEYAPDPDSDSAPWPAFDRRQVGRYAWERMSWLIQMPRARVAGTVTLDGQPHAIDATGYHDHNWGEWIPTDALWNWAQLSTQRLSLELGDFIGRPAGVLALDLDGVRTVFTPDQYTLAHTRWAWDAANRLFYPVESLLTADNGALRLEVTLRALATEPLRGDLPAPLRDLIIYEQTARYDGRVWERAAGDASGGGGALADGADAAGGWRVRAWVRGTGFKEWTGKKY
jgi:hypothetical protein